MGLIRAAVGAVGGTLSDSWLDYIRAENMTPTTILTKGEQVGKQHRRGNADIISNGSRIEVGANQMLFLTEGGKIVPVWRMRTVRHENISHCGCWGLPVRAEPCSGHRR